MANLYDKFQDEREKAKSFWDSFAKSYGTAYNTAFKSFHAELKKQEQTRMKRREMMLSFAFFALSLTGGSILLDGTTTDAGDFDVADGSGNIVLSTNVTIDTEQGNNDNVDGGNFNNDNHENDDIKGDRSYLEFTVKFS